MINMKPVEAIQLESVEQPGYPEKSIPDDLPIDSTVRYLYKLGEEAGDNRHRAPDPIWSVDAYEIDEIRSFDGQPSLYTLGRLDSERTFTKEQLLVIPSDTNFDCEESFYITSNIK